MFDVLLSEMFFHGLEGQIGDLQISIFVLIDISASVMNMYAHTDLVL